MSMYEDDYFEEDMVNAAEMAGHQTQDDDTTEYATGGLMGHNLATPEEVQERLDRWLESAKRTASEKIMHSPDSYEGRMLKLREANPGVPAYYLFPGGVQVKDIAGHLTSNGGQAVQYVARSTRLDGRNKGEQLSDIRKAIDMLQDELRRMGGSDA